MPAVARLVELGLPTVVTRELMNQIAGTSPALATRYVEQGVAPVLAIELAARPSGNTTMNRLIEAGMPEDLAREVIN